MNLQAHKPTIKREHCELHQVQRAQQRLRRHVHRQDPFRLGDEAELDRGQLWGHVDHLTGL